MTWLNECADAIADRPAEKRLCLRQTIMGTVPTMQYLFFL